MVLRFKTSVSYRSGLITEPHPLVYNSPGLIIRALPHENRCRTVIEEVSINLMAHCQNPTDTTEALTMCTLP